MQLKSALCTVLAMCVLRHVTFTISSFHLDTALRDSCSANSHVEVSHVACYCNLFINVARSNNFVQFIVLQEFFLSWRNSTPYPPPRGPGPPHYRGFVITHNDTPQLVGLLWTSDQPDPETQRLAVAWMYIQATARLACTNIPMRYTVNEMTLLVMDW